MQVMLNGIDIYGVKMMYDDQPISKVLWVDINEVEANDYNPNSVAKAEMRLLYTSILQDGYTQPVVTIYDEKMKKYIIIDGFHRYSVLKGNKDIAERTDNKLPIVVLNKTMSERMASTVRHNRARGSHSVTGMSSLVFSMLDEGCSDEKICQELGMEPDELLRLKHITGFSKLFENADYKKSWKSKQQILYEKEYKNKA
jgi:ParB-like chromosome segregation protein Spo0J